MVGMVGIHCTSRGCPEGGPWHDVYAVTSYLTDERKQVLGGVLLQSWVENREHSFLRRLASIMAQPA